MGETMKNKIIILITIIMLSIGMISSIAIFAQDEEKHNYMPENGYVPDEETAVKIAVAVWIPIYGKEQIESEKPYNAELKENIWHVSGSLPEGWLGGVAIAEIDKKTGKILRISHGE